MSATESLGATWKTSPLSLSSRVSLSLSLFSVRQPRIPGRSGSGSDVRNAGLPWRERSREKQAKSSWGPGERGWDWEDRDGADDAVQASKRRWDLARASKLGDSPLSGGGLCHCHFPSNSMTLRLSTTHGHSKHFPRRCFCSLFFSSFSSFSLSRPTARFPPLSPPLVYVTPTCPCRSNYSLPLHLCIPLHRRWDWARQV